MPATQEGSSSRLLPSIVRVNSESDIDEVINEEVAKLPVIVNNTIEGELKEKWWMKQRNRFNIRATRTKHKNLWYKKTSIHHHLPPLQGRSILQNNSDSTNMETPLTSDVVLEDIDSSNSNIFRPWKIRHNSIFAQSGSTVRSLDELNQSSTSTIVSKPFLSEQSLAQISAPNRGIQLMDLGQIQNNNAIAPVLKTSPTRKKPNRLYNKLSTKPPNYEFFGFLNSPEKLNSFFVINGEVENQLGESTNNISNLPKQINKEIAPAATVDDCSTVTEHSLAVKSVTFDGSMLDDQESQISIDAIHKSTISITNQIGVNVTLDDDNSPTTQGQHSINMKINITLPAEINAASVKREIVPQPLKVRQPKPTQPQEPPAANTMQVDNTTLQNLLKDSRVQFPESTADKKSKKQAHKHSIVVKHLIPCVPKQSIDWDNYPDMMINGTKFGEYVYRGLQASAAAVLSRIIDKLYRQLGKGKAKNLAKLLRSLKGDLSNLVDHVELMKLLRDPEVRKLLAKGLDKETAKQFQALLAHMFKNGKLPPGMEGDLFQLFNGNLLDNPELTDELLDALQDDPAQEIALLCSLLNNPDISAKEKEMIKEMLRKKIAGDGSNQKLVATLLEMINNGTIDASMFGDGNMDINEIIEQLKQGKMSDDLVSAVLQMMENGVLNSSLLVDDESGGMMSQILQALREGNSAILGDDEDGITSKILKALKEGKIDMKTALKAILEAKSNKKGGVLDKIMKKLSRSARRRHRRKGRRRRHGSGSYSDSSDYSSDDESGSWTSSSYDSSSYTSGGERKRRRRKKHHRRHHKRRGSGDEYSSSYSSSYYSSDESEFEFTRSGKHKYARDRRKHRRHRSGRDSKGRSRRSKHKGTLGDDLDFDPTEMSAMGDISAALALCKDVSGEAQMEYYKKRREEALKEKEAQEETAKWLRLAQERRQAAEKTLEEKMAAEQLAKEEAEEARRRYVEEYLGEARMELEKQLERRRLEKELLAKLGIEDNVTRTIREQQQLMEQKFKTEAQRKRIAEQMEKLRKERTDRRIELQYEHHILNEYDDYVTVWEEQELEYIKYYCGEECVARVMKAHAEKMARRAKERAARERAILDALQDELMGTLEMIKTKQTLGYLKEGERLEIMHNSARSYFSYFCFVDMNKGNE